MAKSRDWDELTWVWTEWRRKSARPMRDLFEQLADLTNDAAKYNSKLLKTYFNYNELQLLALQISVTLPITGRFPLIHQTFDMRWKMSGKKCFHCTRCFTLMFAES